MSSKYFGWLTGAPPKHKWAWNSIGYTVQTMNNCVQHLQDKSLSISKSMGRSQLQLPRRISVRDIFDSHFQYRYSWMWTVNILALSPVMRRHTEGNRKAQIVPRKKNLFLSQKATCILSNGKTIYLQASIYQPKLLWSKGCSPCLCVFVCTMVT